MAHFAITLNDHEIRKLIADYVSRVGALRVKPEEVKLKTEDNEDEVYVSASIQKHVNQSE